MQSNILPIFFLALIFSNSCSNTKKSSDLHLNENVSVNETGYDITLYEVVSEKREFKFKVPCPFPEKNDVSKKLLAAGEINDILICNAGHLKFTVSSKNSESSLSKEFEKLMKEKSSHAYRRNDIKIFEYVVNEATTTKNANLPAGESTVVKKTWNQVNLIHDKWQITLEAACESAEQKFCDDIFADNDGIVKGFLNSLELLKK